ncbi:hypothetical protein WA026_015075, partial [Henosepilachna vigintioctopunctata]
NVGPEKKNQRKLLAPVVNNMREAESNKNVNGGKQQEQKERSVENLGHEPKIPAVL